MVSLNVPIHPPQRVNNCRVILTVTKPPQNHTLENTLYQKHKPTLTCFQVKMSHVASFTAATSSGLTDEEHTWFIFILFFSQWPWILMFGSKFIFRMWACVDLTQFLWADWLLIPYTSVHIVTVAMAVSLLIAPTTPTHIYFIDFFLSCHFISSVTKLNLHNAHFFPAFFINLRDKAVIKPVVEICVCLCAPMHDWSSSALTGISLLHPLFSHSFDSSECDLCTLEQTEVFFIESGRGSV